MRRVDVSTWRKSGGFLSGEVVDTRVATAMEKRGYIPPPPPLLHARGRPPGLHGGQLIAFGIDDLALPGARHPLRGTAGEVFPLDPLGGLFSGNQRVLPFQFFAGLNQV